MATNRVNVLVAGVCGLVILALLAVGMNKVRERNGRIQCGKNLSQIGRAMHSFHGDHERFPAGGITAEASTENRESGSIFWRTRSYLGLNVAPSSRHRAEVFVCPSRRSVKTANGKHDFAFASIGNGKSGVMSVFATWQTDATRGVHRVSVINADGAAATLMLTHKGMPTSTYANKDVQIGDFLWQDPITENFVRPAKIQWEEDPASGAATANLIGSPHPRGMPTLICDGGVKNLLYYNLTAEEYYYGWGINDQNGYFPDQRWSE